MEYSKSFTSRPDIRSKSTKDLKLSDFQQWVLAFFVKEPNAVMSEEEIIDNMCLTALLDFDLDTVGNSLEDLKKYDLVRYQEDNVDASIREIKAGQNISIKKGFIGTLKGRVYFKQNIILPLVLAKREDKLKQIITFLNDTYGENPLAKEIKESLTIKEQNELVHRWATIATEQFVPFMNILAKIQERFFGSL